MARRVETVIENSQGTTPEEPADRPGRVLMQVRWSDVDLFGHVNNGAFLRYLDDARFMLFAHMGVDEAGAMTASLLVVVKHEIDYVAPLTFRQRAFAVDVWVTKVGRSSVDFAYRIGEPDAETDFVRARSRMVQLDYATRKPRAFTNEERANLLRFPGPVPHLHPF